MSDIMMTETVGEIKEKEGGRTNGRIQTQWTGGARGRGSGKIKGHPWNTLKPRID
jgi:hypothetical protein